MVLFCWSTRENYYFCGKQQINQEPNQGTCWPVRQDWSWKVASRYKGTIQLTKSSQIISFYSSLVYTVYRMAEPNTNKQTVQYITLRITCPKLISWYEIVIEIATKNEEKKLIINLISNLLSTNRIKKCL